MEAGKQSNQIIYKIPPYVLCVSRPVANSKSQVLSMSD